MPKFMKDKAVELLSSGVEAYILALYGLTLPNMRMRKHMESKYAPIMGLFGASTELIVKACLVQEKSVEVLYKNDDPKSNVYKIGTEVLKELRKDVCTNDSKTSFLWKSESEQKESREKIIFYLDKFRLLQNLRAEGLHAGIGCSRDVAVSTANDIYDFIVLLSQGKRLKAYLKNIPAPEDTVKDREALIEDLSRRLNSKKDINEKIGYLNNMYLVLPYVPDVAPDWLDRFEEMLVVPPSVNEVNYLVRSLSDAHSIYLLKSRGGKNGIPMKIDENDPNAIPIGVQYIKRTLKTIPDQFNNDILSANTRLEQNRLDLPIDDSLMDLFAIGLKQAGVLPEKTKLTAQMAWPFVVSAYSTQGTPRPCMEFIQNCDELSRLINFIKRASRIGNGYFKKRADFLVRLLNAIGSSQKIEIKRSDDKIFKELLSYKKSRSEIAVSNPFTPQFIMKSTFSSETNEILGRYIKGTLSAGSALEEILLTTKTFDSGNGDRRAINQLIKMCTEYEDRNGLMAVLKNDSLSGFYSQVRKKIFYIDFYNFCQGVI
ncbi:hypothetical protein [Lactobacillus delbrueckii]|uniref:hypothetical protein n=1 Tax=Lactobacillus delbrueckii TaxID=1584 RepID=UPI001F492B6F|nr:hypothetical protein [Lactobacillus delbrueckii]GHN43266.1 hypothetical protein ME797_06320 [Lactobacillus delbrueckii]